MALNLSPDVGDRAIAVLMKGMSYISYIVFREDTAQTEWVKLCVPSAAVELLRFGQLHVDGFPIPPGEIRQVRLRSALERSDLHTLPWGA